MAAMTNSQSVATQLEKVRKKLPLMFERDDVLFAQIKARGDTERSRDKSTGFDLRNSILRLGYQVSCRFLIPYGMQYLQQRRPSH